MLLISHLTASSVLSDTNLSIIVYWMTLKYSDIYFVHSYVFVTNKGIHVDTMYYSVWYYRMPCVFQITKSTTHLIPKIILVYVASNITTG